GPARRAGDRAADALRPCRARRRPAAADQPRAADRPAGPAGPGLRRPARGEGPLDLDRPPEDAARDLLRRRARVPPRLRPPARRRAEAVQGRRVAMAATGSLGAFGDLLDRLGPIGGKQRGERIEAEQWNALVEVVKGLLTLEAQQEAGLESEFKDTF